MARPRRSLTPFGPAMMVGLRSSGRPLRPLAKSKPAEKDPLRRLSVPDAAQRSFAFAEGPPRPGMERAICHGPRQPTVADDHRPIGEPGGDKLPRQLVGYPAPFLLQPDRARRLVFLLY